MPKKELFCPVEITLDALSGRWKVLIIQQLLDGTRRFNQLQRELQGITHRTLSKQLKEMEEHGLVNRKDYKEIPPRVEYSLSELGKSLESVLSAMHKWGEAYGSKITSKEKL
ncbi:MAG: helix-turn-helix transcriptional regulator [Rhodospirillales bacterium]|nr:helix-turn-helix transcriptional regulator [Rhodospirillales bacterium]